MTFLNQMAMQLVLRSTLPLLENFVWVVIGLTQKGPGCVAFDHRPAGPVRSGHLVM